MQNKNRYLVAFVLVIILMFLLFRIFYNNQPEPDYHPEELQPEETRTWTSYIQDSTIKVVADTVMTLYSVKTGQRLSTLYASVNDIYSIAMHPSDNVLAVLNQYTVSFYDLKKDDIYNPMPDTTLTDDFQFLDVMDIDYLEYSADGKYLMLIDYSNSMVEIFSWPELEHLDTGQVGYWRNFWWVYKKGKIIFYYTYSGYKKYTFQMEFPATNESDDIRFSEPVCIDSVEIDDSE